jgi:hypothetical protein
MDARDYLVGFCQLIINGFSAKEAKEKMEQIKAEMEQQEDK